MKLSTSQLDAFTITFILALGEWRMASGHLKKDSLYTHPIALTKHYKLYSGRCRDAVLSAFDIFFARESRGHSTARSAAASRWRPRPKATVMRLISSSGNSYEATMSILKKLYESNKDNIHQVKKHIFTKVEEGQVSTVVQTELMWKDETYRTVFEEVALASLAGPSFESKTKFKKGPKNEA
jgi:hypothetical protein